MKKALKRLYSQTRTLLPENLKGGLTKALYGLGLKPTVNRKAKSFLKKGVVIFSGDFELSWAWRYARSAKNFLKKGQLERKNMPKILELFDSYRLPATWATVGHLFLDHCERENANPPHLDLIRPQYFANENWRFKSGDWYDHDPCSDLKSDPEWYASDLIEKILKSKVKHEIACHTFSHIDFSDRNCPPELADSEIKKCLEVAQKFNIRLESMVFPGRTYGNFGILKKRGFLCYRKLTQFDVDIPIIDKYGLIVIPESSILERDPYGWSKDFHIQSHRKYLDEAIEHRLVCHFWFHPCMDEWYLSEVFHGIIGYVSEQRDREKVEVMTMKKLADFIGALPKKK